MHVQMTVRVHERTFLQKNSSCFEDQDVHVTAALFINCFHQLVFNYFLEKIRSRLLDETELSS